MLIHFLEKPAGKGIENIWEVSKIYCPSQHAYNTVWPFKVSWS